MKRFASKEEDVNSVRNILSDAGCVLEGDYFFALKKRGLVSKKYINLDPILTQPRSVLTIAKELIAPFSNDFSCLVGPAIGGIPLIYAAAFHATQNLESIGIRSGITTAFAGKVGDGFAFDRMGFANAVSGKNVLVLEDISSTGETTKRVCDLIEHVGGKIIGASLIWNRGELTANSLGVPKLHATVTESVKTWRVEQNPPGWGELPLVSDIGHPEYYPDYPGGTISLLS